MTTALPKEYGADRKIADRKIISAYFCQSCFCPFQIGWAKPAIAIFLLCGLHSLRAEEIRRSNVGLPAQIRQLVLPGTELEAKPLKDDRMPIVLRVVATFPHGTAFRYDLEYYGLEPGTFDLKDYLQRRDQSSTADLPNLPVEIVSVLPPGQVLPNALAPSPTPSLRGYRTILSVAAIAWLAGLLAIIWWIVGDRFRRRGAAAGKRALSLADRLRPIIQDAVAGKTSDIQLAELERMLFTFWRRRLKLDHLTAADTMRELRGHPEASALLEQLEVWLHQPGSTKNVNVAALLEPYQNLPAEAMEAK